MADIKTDALYKSVRTTYGQKRAKANGYRAQFFFRLEQRTVLEHLHKNQAPIVDIACGSGLMLEPLMAHGKGAINIYGLDYNNDACIAAQSNQLTTIRGDAFKLPFPADTIGQFVNCQFLNQQTPENARLFVGQLAKALQPGGRAIILWRHGNSLLHRVAHSIFLLLDRLKKAPKFPQYIHSMEQVKLYAQEAGLGVLKESITLPVSYPRSVPSRHWFGDVLGASFMLVLSKPVDNSS
jgi:ubiquinone/menaquinone biosynthesis C-methylase UbiE